MVTLLAVAALNDRIMAEGYSDSGYLILPLPEQQVLKLIWQTVRDPLRGVRDATVRSQHSSSTAPGRFPNCSGMATPSTCPMESTSRRSEWRSRLQGVRRRTRSLRLHIRGARALTRSTRSSLCRPVPTEHRFDSTPHSDSGRWLTWRTRCRTVRGSSIACMSSGVHVTSSVLADEISQKRRA
jgi:hypothetical protein